uniref:HAT C-terminal dimerisation domain-containing protein n=1 Tax=Panagrolaimus superbus TaxID=310955 RepID=A0A914Z3R1_9BILA
MLGQGYDGAANMCGINKGVSTRIQKLYPAASYFHCAIHGLNLGLNIDKNLAIKKELYPAIIDTLQELVDTRNDPDADNYLQYFLTAEAIFALFVAVKVTEPLLCLSKTLQKPDNDLIAAFSHIMSVKAMLESWIANENEFNILYVKMKEVCEEYELPIDFTRRAVVDGLDFRFGNQQQAAFSLQYLLPSKTAELSFEMVEEAVNQYIDFLPNYCKVENEILMWKGYCSLLQNRPSNLKDTLALFSTTTSEMYPNIKTLLVILATLPVTTGIVEKSFSILRHIFWRFSCLHEYRTCISSCLAFVV